MVSFIMRYILRARFWWLKRHYKRDMEEATHSEVPLWEAGLKALEDTEKLLY